jgi:hypothetical protein
MARSRTLSPIVTHLGAAPEVYERIAQIPEVAKAVELLLLAAAEYEKGDREAGDRLAFEFDKYIPHLMRYLEEQAALGKSGPTEALAWFRVVYPEQTN